MGGGFLVGGWVVGFVVNVGIMVVVGLRTRETRREIQGERGRIKK